MSRSFRLPRLLYGIVLLAALAACGLPGDVKRAGEAFPARFTEAEKEIARKEGAYADYVRSLAYEIDRAYAERERWVDAFAAARRELAGVRTTYGRELMPLLLADEMNSQWTVRTQVARMDSLLAGAVAVADRPFARRDYLAAVRRDAPVLAARADSAHAAVKAPLASLRATLLAARRDHPGKREDLNRKLAGVDSAAAAADSALRGVRAQLG
ncbi:MAG TPA: hypothetical protein VLK84_11185, partial [Longimicrobium sp.]|nr:hypothetical protein [Longimicrobium sp.]